VFRTKRQSTWSCIVLAAMVWSAPLHADSTKQQRALEAEANELEQRLIRCGCTYDHPAVDAYLQGIAERLLATDAKPPPGPVRVRALKNTSSNAFALPNGAIFVTTALLQRLDSEAQLATVLGHELTHFTNGHSLQELQAERRKSMWSKALSAVFALGVGLAARDANAGRLAAAVSSDAGELWYLASVSGYSQDLEREADREGMRRLVAAGYDASEGVVSFERLAAAAHDEGSEEETPYFSSHPRLLERIGSYRSLVDKELAAAVGGGRETGRDAYLAHTRGMALDQVSLLLDAQALDRALAILGPELERADSARGRYLEGEIARRRERSAAGEAQALAAFERAQALPDPPPEAFRQAGLIRRRHGDNGRAAQDFAHYLAMAPTAVDAPLVRAYLATQSAQMPAPPPAASQ
jgi:predicted Zn-dependent protease